MAILGGPAPEGGVPRPLVALMSALRRVVTGGGLVVAGAAMSLLGVGTFVATAVTGNFDGPQTLDTIALTGLICGFALAVVGAGLHQMANPAPDQGEARPVREPLD